MYFRSYLLGTENELNITSVKFMKTCQRIFLKMNQLSVFHGSECWIIDGLFIAFFSYTELADFQTLDTIH